MPRRPVFKLDDAFGDTVREALESGSAKLERWRYPNDMVRNGKEYPLYVYAMRVPSYPVAFVINKRSFDFGIEHGNYVLVDEELQQPVGYYGYWGPGWDKYR